MLYRIANNQNVGSPTIVTGLYRLTKYGYVGSPLLLVAMGGSQTLRLSRKIYKWEFEMKFIVKPLIINGLFSWSKSVFHISTVSSHLLFLFTA